MEHPAAEGGCAVALVVFLKGAEGWLTEDATIERAEGKRPRQWLPDPNAPQTTVAFRSGDVVVPLRYGGDPPMAVVWSYDVPVADGNVLLMSGIREDGPRVRALGSHRVACEGDTPPPQRLYDRLVQVRAKIHYSR